MSRQYRGDRAAADVVPQIGERTLDSAIAPRPILFCHLHDQVLDFAWRLRSSRRAPLLAAVVLLCDQPPMPGQQSFRRDDRAQLDQHLPAQTLGLCSQPTTLIVGEVHPLPAQLLAKNTIFFSKVVDER